MWHKNLIKKNYQIKRKFFYQYKRKKNSDSREQNSYNKKNKRLRERNITSFAKMGALIWSFLYIFAEKIYHWKLHR